MPKPPTYTAQLERATKRGAALYVTRVTPAQEYADEDRWLAANARVRSQPSTSVRPWLCRCGEWSAAERDRCRVCGSARVA